MATILIGTVVIGLMFLAGVKAIRDRKNGNCGCGCEHCNAHCQKVAHEKQ